MHALRDAPVRDVAIVLGARVYDSGRPSPFLRSRLDLAEQLFRGGQVKVILVSGANTAASNHETDAMRDYLIAKGIPAESVIADPKGFDTFDSCIRARRVFGITSATITTQGYHLPRALALCSAVGIDAVGVGDYSPRGISAHWRNGVIREWFAGPKVELDLLFGRVDDESDPAVLNALKR